jgi:hypothetical protein
MTLDVYSYVLREFDGLGRRSAEELMADGVRVFAPARGPLPQPSAPSWSAADGARAMRAADRP